MLSASPSKIGAIAARYLDNIADPANQNAVQLSPNSKKPPEVSPVKAKKNIDSSNKSPENTPDIYSKARLRKVDPENKENLRTHTLSGVSRVRASPRTETASRFGLTVLSPEEKGNPLGHPLISELQKFNTTSLRKTNPSPQGSKPTGNKGYEYLCRLAEIKAFLEQYLGHEICDVHSLARNGLRDGVILAQIAQKFAPELVKRVVPASKRGVEYKHTENIVNFFYLLDYIDMVDLFRFDLTDLYEGKNIPKVVVCLYTLCYMLSQHDKMPKLLNLAGQLEFEESEIKWAERELKMASVPDLASFEGVLKGLDVKIGDELMEHHSATEDRSETPSEMPAQEDNFDENTHDIDEQLSHQFSDSLVLAPIKIPKTRNNVKSLGDIDENEVTNDFSENEEKNTVKFTQSTLRRVETIKKPKYTDFSIAEIEDTTVIQEQDLELDEDQLDAALRSIILIQSLGRGFITRFQVFVKETLLNTFKPEIVALQSISRGFLARGTLSYITHSPRKARHHRKNVSSRDVASFIVPLQAIVRGRAFRHELMSMLRTLRAEKHHIVRFQAIIRGEILRFYTESAMLDFEDFGILLTPIQAAMRGALVRLSLRKTELDLARSSKQIMMFQSIVRGALLRATMLKNLSFLENFGEESLEKIVLLQAVMRRILFHRQNVMLLLDEQDCAAQVALQSIIRGHIARLRVRDIYYQVYKARKEVLALQSVARGALARTTIGRSLLTALRESYRALNGFTAIIRGFFLRRSIAQRIRALKKQKHSVLSLQANIRGVLSRFHTELFLDCLWDEELSIARLQRVCKGFLVRKRILDMERYYKTHLKEIVFVQSYLRARYQNDAYRQLVVAQKPLLAVVRQFAHLLNDTSKDFEEEVKLEALGLKIAEKNEQNAQLETHCNELDAKIALLVKNKITLDEIVSQNKRASLRMFDQEFKRKIGTEGTKANETARRKRYEVYELVIYVLQTCPEYFIRIFEAYRGNASVINRAEQIVKVVFDIRDWSQNSRPKNGAGTKSDGGNVPIAGRNEFLFVNMICAALSSTWKKIQNFNDFIALSEDSLWLRLLLTFNKSDIQKKIVKSIFGPLLTLVSEIDGLLMESDPVKIYRSIIEASEAETGRKSPKKVNVTAETAIQDPDTRQKFVANLGLLRETVFRALVTLEENLAKIPPHIRSIVYAAHSATLARFGTDFADRCAMKTLISYYVEPVFVNPEMFDIPLITFSAKETMRLKESFSSVVYALDHVCQQQEFPTGDFLQPLNEFVMSSQLVVKRILRGLLSSGDAENVYGINLYSDLTSKSKPSLVVTNGELALLRAFLDDHIQDLAPEKGDPIRAYIGKLASVGSSHDFDKEVVLKLNPAVKAFSGVKTRSMVLDAKRCILYIMQVQKGRRNLLDLLLLKISEEDEARYREILEAEGAVYDGRPNKESSQNEFSKSTFYRNAATMLFHKLKSHALEVILELEAMGRVTREDKFQSLLDEIAFDIKTAHDQRIKRAKELSLSIQTLESLEEKEKYLKNLLETYHKYINKSMAALQESGVGTAKTTPFSKQFFFQRALRKKNKASKFGVFKYSARYLYEHGILVEINGIKHLDLLKADFVFSCDQVGVFVIELEGGMIDDTGRKVYMESAAHVTNVRNPHSRVTLDELLQNQYEGKKRMGIYNGIIVFDTINLLTFVFKKFYERK